MNTKLARALVASLFVAAASGAAYATDKVDHNKSATAQYIDDASITANIKAKHAEDKTVRVTSIGVETKDGVVQLSGFTPSAAEKARAEELARSVKGVKSVRNDIVIRP